MNLSPLTWWSNKQKQARPKKRAQLEQEFWQRPEHQWVQADLSVARSFKWFWQALPEQAIAKLAHLPAVIFVLSSGRLSGTYYQSAGVQVVLVFPDLLKILKSADPGWGVATLAHELGHVLQEHSGQVVDPLQAQLEADQWVVSSGLAQELEGLLLSLPESRDKRVRLSHLTATLAKTW